MKNNKKRLYTFFGIASLLLTALVFGRRFFGKSESIGDFQMPVLAGWERKATRSERRHVVKYEKKNADTRLYIGLSWRRDRTNNPAKNVQDLFVEEAQDSARMAKITASLGLSVSSSPPQTTTINGMTAVESKSVSRNESRTTYIKSVRFINGNNLYDLVSNIRVPPTAAPTPPANLQVEMEQALAKIEGALKPSS